MNLIKLLEDTVVDMNGKLVVTPQGVQRIEVKQGETATLKLGDYVNMHRNALAGIAALEAFIAESSAVIAEHAPQLVDEVDQ